MIHQRNLDKLKFFKWKSTAWTMFGRYKAQHIIRQRISWINWYERSLYNEYEYRKRYILTEWDNGTDEKDKVNIIEI